MITALDAGIELTRHRARVIPLSTGQIQHAFSRYVPNNIDRIRAATSNISDLPFYTVITTTQHMLSHLMHLVLLVSWYTWLIQGERRS
jgi:hypothetical protein